MNRYFISFVLTLFIYTSVISAFLYSLESDIKDIKNSPQRVQISILATKFTKQDNKIIKSIKKKQKTEKLIARIKKSQDHIVKIDTNTKSKNTIELKKQKYIELIKQAIAKNKKYPKVALRRNIQGDIQVNFIVSKDGLIKEIKIIKGKKVFYKAVKKAIIDSFPIDIDENIFDDDLKLNLIIKFKVNTNIM
jgi:outer membrane biosynthesis protein TonB